MALEVTCPSCGHSFQLEEALSEEYKDKLEGEKQALRNEMIDWKKKMEDEVNKREAAHQQQLQSKDAEAQQRLAIEKEKLQTELKQSLHKSISADFENAIKRFQEDAADNEEKLKAARKRELEFLQKENDLKTKEAELEITLHKRLIEEREKLSIDIKKIEEQRMAQKEAEMQMRLAEADKKMKDQEKLIDEMKRKAEQGSMQLQGEVQELMLQEILSNTFPFDTIEEVGKGVRGADCIQVIRNQFGTEAGKIIYESKRTKDFANDWIEKLKKDMRSNGADIAVIVTQTLPKDMERFGQKDDVYICTFGEVRSVALLLRNALLKIFEAKKSRENKGDKMVMLYDYLTGSEFGEQWKAVREGFMSMRLSIQKERDAMEKLWKAREKQLEKVLLNAAHIKGSIEGIAGADAVNLNLIEDTEPLELE
jgi:hypothetical protein